MGSWDVIGDDELVYRKISVNSGWYDPEHNEVKPEVFKPFERDTNGISVDRAHSEQNPVFRRIEEAAQGKSTGGYFVAVLRVGDLRSHGIRIEPKSIQENAEENAGHAELPDLAYGDRKTVRAQEMRVLLAHKLVLEVHGPFG